MPIIISLLGIAVTTVYEEGPSVDLIPDNQLMDYSFTTTPITLSRDVMLRCSSGLGPPGSDGSVDLGGWYFQGTLLPMRSSSGICGINSLEMAGANGRRHPGVINAYLCGTFTTTEEGVFECRMMNSSNMVQTMRVGVYFDERSESLDMYPHHLIVNHLSSLYIAAPMIDPPSSPVGVAIGMSVTLSCTSRGSPPDTFTLIKDSVPVNPSPNVTTVNYTNSTAVFRIDYTFDNFTEFDVGTYTCTVTNPIGSDSETITLQIG